MPWPGEGRPKKKVKPTAPTVRTIVLPPLPTMRLPPAWTLTGKVLQRLHPAAVVVLGMLMWSHDGVGHSWPDLKQVAEATGLSGRIVRTALAELTAAGIIAELGIHASTGTVVWQFQAEPPGTKAPGRKKKGR